MAKYKNTRESYFLGTLTAFSIAYFMTYILGNILIEISNMAHLGLLGQWGQFMVTLLGPAIGIGVAYKYGLSYIGILSTMLAGSVGLGSLTGSDLQVAAPLMAYLCVLVCVFIVRMLEGKTPIDLFLLPICSIAISGLLREIIMPYLGMLLGYIMNMMNSLMNTNPLLMGMVVALVAGLLFTSPITLVAITSLLDFTPLACGAALAGVMSHMLGFGLMSLQDNDIGDTLAVIFGTSMLQFTNCIKRPVILIPPVVTSMICGLLSAGLFKITTTLDAAAMGGTAWIGIFDTVSYMGMQYWILPVIGCIILPIVINFSIYQLFRKAGYIRNGDLKLIK